MLTKVVNKEAWFRRIGYVPHEAQQKFHDSTARFKILCAGSRFGKSLCASKEVEPIIATPNTRGWIVAPTYSLGEKEFRYIFEDFMTKAGPEFRPTQYSENVRTGNLFMKFPWGSWVEVKSAENPQSCLGEELDWIITSEGSQLKKNFYERYLRARLTSRQGRLIVPTTPAGHGGWLLDMFNKGQEKKDGYESWQFPTWENPLIPKSEIESARANMSPELFAEQYEGKFVQYAGAVYKEFNRSVHVIKPFIPPKTWRRECGIDWGFTAPFVCLWSAFDFDGNCYIFDEHYQAGKGMDYHAMVIEEKTKEHSLGLKGVDIFWCDPSEPGLMEEMQIKGIPCVGAENDISLGLETVRQRLKTSKVTGKPRLFITANCVNLIEEFLNYHYPEKFQDEGGTEKPVKADDHALDALRYILAGRPDPAKEWIDKVIKDNSYQQVFDLIRKNKSKELVIGNQRGRYN